MPSDQRRLTRDLLVAAVAFLVTSTSVLAQGSGWCGVG
jgi:hypothetical protein